MSPYDPAAHGDKRVIGVLIDFDLAVFVVAEFVKLHLDRISHWHCAFHAYLPFGSVTEDTLGTA